jgi:puromycin-sensitive aminopeptidase
VSLGKNFRLPLDARPTRYNFHLAPDLTARTFEGRGEIELSLSTPRRELTLHAIELPIARARVRLPGGAAVRATVTTDAESETVTFTFPEALPAGACILDVAWSGKFSPGLRGLYRAGPTAVTQFEAADARRVFPCFDEPAFKAKWALTLLGVPKDAAAISNGRITKDEPLAGDSTGARQVAFSETPLLSSYLIALCVGDLAGSDTATATAANIPIRTWSVQSKKHLTAFAQECAAAVLPLLEDYFGQPYAYGKLDQIGVPDFEAGAMENAGCITYREVALLLDPATAPLSVQKRVAEVITHELAHQWFGNLVTMVWWDDLWLNEAFATWMAYKVVNWWKPGWRVWMDFQVGTGAALHLDALQSSHPIRAEIKNAEEAGEAFDAITYEKGGAILRMIEAWLGEDAFRDGIRLYMKRHKEGNATADDLWGALAESSGQPILDLANGWIRQVGYPVVEITEKDGRVRLRQRRFFSDPDARETGAGTRWLVPVVLRYRDQSGTHEKRVLLENDELEVDLRGPDGHELQWVLANTGARGFYRCAYSPEWLRRLITALPELAPEERMSLVSDQWALVRSGQGAVTGFLDLLLGFGAETDHTVLDEVLARLSWLEARGVSEMDRPLFHAVVAKLFAAQGADLGWHKKDGEGDEVRLRRAAVLRALTLIARDPDAVTAAQEQFAVLSGHHPAAVDPNLLDVVVAAAARTADQARFDALKARAAAEVDPAARRRFLHALAMVESPALVQQSVELVLTDAVQMQDVSSFLGVLMGNRATRAQAFALVRDRWAEVHQKADSPMLLRRLVEGLGALPERKDLLAVEAFLAAHPIEGARQAVAQTLERMRMDVALRERLLPELEVWLRKHA